MSILLRFEKEKGFIFFDETKLEDDAKKWEHNAGFRCGFSYNPISSYDEFNRYCMDRDIIIYDELEVIIFLAYDAGTKIVTGKYINRYTTDKFQDEFTEKLNGLNRGLNVQF